MVKAVNAEAVLAYLQTHPEFLSEHADTLGISLHSGKVRSIAALQLEQHRAKIKRLGDNIRSLVSNAGANEALFVKIMRLAQALQQDNTVLQMLASIDTAMEEDFRLPDYALRWWRPQTRRGVVPEDFYLDSSAQIASLSKLSEPICTQHPPLKEMLDWLPETDKPYESFLILPLPVEDATAGVWVFGHSDPEYFNAETDTLFVEQLGRLVAAALRRALG